MTQYELELVNYYGISGEHPDYPKADWKACVRNFETYDGYWQWCATSTQGMHSSKHRSLTEQDPEFSIESWIYAVSHDETYEGYSGWCVREKKNALHDFRDSLHHAD